MEEEEEECEEGAPAWMATFSDMATLLLTFFVLLLSFANMDVQNFRVALGSVKEAFGVQVSVKGDIEGMTTSPVELSTVQSLPTIEKPPSMDDDVAAIVAYLKKKQLEKKIDVLATPRGIVLRVKDVVLFATGSDELNEKADPVLAAVGELFGKFDGDMTIEGHTDNVPISRGRFRSNWELSTARAISVMRELAAKHEVPAMRVRVAGYADSKPIAKNEIPEGRSKNRRVEFLFEKDPQLTREKKPRRRAFRLPFNSAPH
ncbi:MAG: OmpA family protein [Polyangiaceae bacterium]